MFFIQNLVTSSSQNTSTTMRRTLTYAPILFLLWALFARWYYTCYIKNTCCDDQVAMAHVTTLRLAKSNGDDILRGYEQFVYADQQINANISANQDDFLNKTATYLKANPTEKLTIMCCHRATEMPNIAEGRAAFLKDALLKKGVEATQILTEICKDNNNQLLTPVFFTINATNEVVNAVPKDISQESIFDFNISDENFASNSAQFKPSPAFVAKAKELKAYSTTHSGINLEVTGHTDNVGNDAANLKLGQKRAEAVKKYFINMGIKANITTASKGETAPRASNETPEGRAANRRVSCKILS